MAHEAPTPLSEIRERIDEAETRGRSLVDGLDEAELIWQPAPGRWSIAHCLEHLNLTGTFYLETMEAAIAEAPRCSDGPVASKPGWFERKFLQSIAPHSRFRGPAPKKIVPRLDGSPSAVAETFFALQERFRRALEAASEVDVNRTKFRSPLVKILKLRLGVGFQLNALHQLRHLLQAERVKGEDTFPGA